MPNALKTAFWIAVVASVASPGRSASIEVDGHLVETQADGICAGQFIDGDQRYANCLNGTIYDLVTGLFWLEDAACDDLGGTGWGDWVTARTAVAGLEDGFCGLTDSSQPGDWRLPTIEEWEATVAESLANPEPCSSPFLSDNLGDCYGDGSSSSFDDVRTAVHWSLNADETAPHKVVTMSLITGLSGSTPKDSSVAIWPVRRGGAPAEAAAAVVVDGAPVETNADGPCFGDLTVLAERYVDCGDGTVLDAVTGLLWLQDAKCADINGTSGKSWPEAMEQTSLLADGMCGLTDGSQPGDWRIPTRQAWAATVARAKALGCTVDGPFSQPSLMNTPGTACISSLPSPFINLSGLDRFLSSTQKDGDPNAVYEADLSNGNTDGAVEKGPFSRNFWPVRDRR